MREILNEDTPGDWDPARAKSIAAEEALEVLKRRKILWKYEERPSKGFKGDIHKCRSGSPELEEEDEGDKQ